MIVLCQRIGSPNLFLNPLRKLPQSLPPKGNHVQWIKIGPHVGKGVYYIEYAGYCLYSVLCFG